MCNFNIIKMKDENFTFAVIVYIKCLNGLIKSSAVNLESDGVLHNFKFRGIPWEILNIHASKVGPPWEKVSPGSWA